MADHVAVRVDNLSKSFRLPYEKHNTLKGSLLSPISSRKKGYKRLRVLKNLSFEIKQGEFFGVVGRNGGGKSTLLKLLASIYEPDKGSVEIDGKLVPFIELGVGFNPELTGRDNVYLNGALLGFSDREIDAIYDDIVSFAELEEFMDQKLKNYSSGMQVRLAFSVATRSKADILLVDEVLAVGDAAFQRKCYDYFSSLKRDKKTVIFISHDMNAIREYCDRVILLDEGKIEAIGDADEIAESYLRLFTGDTSPKDDNTSARWGDESVKLSIKLDSLTNQLIKLSTNIVAKRKVGDQVAGLSIKDASGAIVYGTNSQLVGQSLPSMEKGQTLNLEWEIPNIFRDGKYYISVASHGYGGLPVYDWWDSAAHFEVNAGRKSPYPIAPAVKLKIS